MLFYTEGFHKGLRLASDGDDANGSGGGGHGVHMVRVSNP